MTVKIKVERGLHGCFAYADYRGFDLSVLIAVGYYQKCLGTPIEEIYIILIISIISLICVAGN